MTQVHLTSSASEMAAHGLFADELPTPRVPLQLVGAARLGKTLGLTERRASAAGSVAQGKVRS